MDVSDDEAIEQPRQSPSSGVDAILDFLRWYAEGRINSRLIDERRTVTPANILAAGRAGLLGLQIEAQYGGRQLSHQDTYRVVEQVAAIDPSLALTVSVHNAVGIPPVRRFAPEPYRAEVLPLLATGQSLATIAASEPGAGSHVRSISTTAVRLPTGEFLLNGGKSWISLGAWAGYVNLFARQVDEKGQPLGITGFLVETHSPGYYPGEEAMTLGMRGIPQNHVRIKDLVVPAHSLLGVEGEGLVAAQTAFMAGRVFVGALSLGAMKRSLQLAHRYAARRVVATGNLANNGRTRQILTRSVIATQAVEALVRHIGRNLDAGIAVPDEIFFACKILSSELMWTVVDSSVQLMGARGYLDTNVVGQFFRDYRLLRIFEGATEAVTVYLGTVVRASVSNFLAKMDRSFSGTRSLHLLRQHLESRRSYSEDVADANALGEIACWAILAAATEKNNDGTLVAQYAEEWALTHLHDKLLATKEDVEILTSGLIAEKIESYEFSIGDLTQNLPGEDTSRDSLLAV